MYIQETILHKCLKCGKTMQYPCGAPDTHMGVGCGGKLVRVKKKKEKK